MAEYVLRSVFAAQVWMRGHLEIQQASAAQAAQGPKIVTPGDEG